MMPWRSVADSTERGRMRQKLSQKPGGHQARGYPAAARKVLVRTPPLVITVPPTVSRFVSATE
jgi:hypothetical protein